MTIAQLLPMFAGIGLFLYGITAMGEGLEYAAGSKMKKILGALTKNRFLLTRLSEKFKRMTK